MRAELQSRSGIERLTRSEASRHVGKSDPPCGVRPPPGRGCPPPLPGVLSLARQVAKRSLDAQQVEARREEDGHRLETEAAGWSREQILRLDLQAEGHREVASGVSDYEDLLRNYTTHAAGALPPIIEDAASRLGVQDDPAKVEALGEALARAYMAGADAGQSEVLAQAAEQGVPFTLNQLKSPEDAD